MYSGAANEINNIDSVLTAQSLAALNDPRDARLLLYYCRLQMLVKKHT